MITTKKPKVSICVPVYNNSELILETVDSILKQTYTDFEVILLDDGSTDNGQTRKTIFSLKDPRIKAFTQENIGIAGAKNAAVSKSCGEYIAFCDHDDLWEPNKLEEQMIILEKNSDIDFAYTGYTTFNKKEGRLVTSPKKKDIKEKDQLFLYAIKNILHNSTAILQRKLWDKIGGFDTSYKLSDDLSFHMHVAYYGKGSFIVNDLVLHRKHPKSSSCSDNASYTFAIETANIFEKWFSSKEMSKKERKYANKKLARNYYSLAKLSKDDKMEYKKWLFKAWKCRPFYRHYLIALLKNNR